MLGHVFQDYYDQNQVRYSESQKLNGLPLCWGNIIVDGECVQ